MRCGCVHGKREAEGETNTPPPRCKRSFPQNSFPSMGYSKSDGEGCGIHRVTAGVSRGRAHPVYWNGIRTMQPLNMVRVHVSKKTAKENKRRACDESQTIETFDVHRPICTVFY